MHGESFVFAIIQGQGRCGISVRKELSEILKGFFPGFLTLGLTQATEEALTLCPVATTKTVCNVSLQVDKTVLLHRLRPVPLHGTLDRKRLTWSI